MHNYSFYKAQVLALIARGRKNMYVLIFVKMRFLSNSRILRHVP